jgi:endoglucanase
VATALVSIPNRYMHSPVEVVSLDDIDRSADLLARFVESIDPDADYKP